MSLVTRRREYASAIAAPPTMKTLPRTPWRVSSSPRAWSARTMVARVKCCSGTIEDLPRKEHAMTEERRRSVGQHVSVERRPRCNEPPGFHEAAGRVDPCWHGHAGLLGEELSQAGEGGVETWITGGRRLSRQKDQLPRP